MRRVVLPSAFLLLSVSLLCACQPPAANQARQSTEKKPARPTADKSLALDGPVNSLDFFGRLIDDELVWKSLALPSGKYTYAWVPREVLSDRQIYRLVIDRPEVVARNERVPSMLFENEIIITVADAGKLVTEADYAKQKKVQASNVFAPAFDVAGKWSMAGGQTISQHQIDGTMLYTFMRTYDDCYDIKITAQVRSLSTSTFFQKEDDRKKSWYVPIEKAEEEIMVAMTKAIETRLPKLIHDLYVSDRKDGVIFAGECG